MGRESSDSLRVIGAEGRVVLERDSRLRGNDMRGSCWSRRLPRFGRNDVSVEVLWPLGLFEEIAAVGPAGRYGGSLAIMWRPGLRDCHGRLWLPRNDSGGCKDEGEALLAPPNEFGAGTSGLVLAP